jgi:mono/diheme cytochrome c family protein
VKYSRKALKILRRAIAAGFLLCALMATFAQTLPSDASLTANPVFQKNCAKCHGKTAEGRHFGGPALISGKVAGATVGDLRSIIADGKEHMPRFAGKLTPGEIDALVQQIEALNKK